MYKGVSVSANSLLEAPPFRAGRPQFTGNIVIMKMRVMMLNRLENNLKFVKATHITIIVTETRRSRYMTKLKIVEYTKDLSLLLSCKENTFLSGSGAVTIRSGAGEGFSIFVPQFRQNLDPVLFL